MTSSSRVRPLGLGTVTQFDLLQAKFLRSAPSGASAHKTCPRLTGTSPNYRHSTPTTRAWPETPFLFYFIVITVQQPPAVPTRVPHPWTVPHPPTDTEPHRGLPHGARESRYGGRGEPIYRAPRQPGALAHGGQLRKSMGRACGGACGRVRLLCGQSDGHDSVSTLAP
jgi:hypothetical protein